MTYSMQSKVLLAAVLALGLSAAGLEAQMNFSVDIDVTSDDAELRGLARSFFSRELRELGDVRVGESGVPDYAVIAIIEKIGRRGWAMSAVISAQFDSDSTTGLAPEVEASLAGYALPVAHTLTRGDSTEDLGREIGLMAKNLDLKVLKPRRKEMKKK